MLWLQVLANGLALGGLYACIAAGFSLVWGVLNVINILHGSLVVLGAYLALFAHQSLGVSPFLFAPVAGALMFVLGFAMHKAVVNRVMGRPVLMSLLLTFGLNLFLDNLLIEGFSADYRKVVIIPPPGVLDFGAVVVPLDRLYATGCGLIAIAALWLLLRATRLGRAIVAVRMDRDAAELMGIDVTSIHALAFGLSAFMAGVAGALVSAIFPISPLASSIYLGKAFVICVLGGLGSVPGVIVGGFSLGLLESFGAVLFGSEHALTVAFLVLIALLMMRPQGLLGRREFQ